MPLGQQVSGQGDHGAVRRGAGDWQGHVSGEQRTLEHVRVEHHRATLARRAPRQRRLAGARHARELNQHDLTVGPGHTGSVPNIRHAAPADATAVTDVVRAAFAPYVVRLGGIEPWPMRLDYAAVIGAGHTWVADDVGQVLGVLVLEPHDDHVLLDVIAVSPASHGSGVGTALMSHAEDVAREQGHREVRLYTNEVMTENLEYYPRRGYVETHRDEVNGFHRVFFVKRL